MTTSNLPGLAGPGGLGIDPAGSYRVLDEADTILMIAHHGRPLDFRGDDQQGRAAVAEAGCSLERWLVWGLPYRRLSGRRQFDPFETLNFMVRAGRERGDPWYASGPVATFRRAAAALEDVSQEERFQVRFRRTVRLRSGASGRLRVPLPLDDPTAEVELIEPDPCSVVSTRWPGRLEVRIPAPDRPLTIAVEVIIRFTPRSHWQPADLNAFEPCDRDDPEYRLYTQPREGLIRVDEKIRRLAEELAPAPCRPWDALRAFWDFFFTRMASGRIHHDEHDPATPLTSVAAAGWFDCLAGSSLLAALCRAVGIPARVVNGLTLYDAIPSNHYWTEVLLPPLGWLSFDLGSWDLAAGDRADRRWSDHYFGRLDARMTYQRFPRQILGPPGVPFPRAWYSVPAVRDGGLETKYIDRDTGELLYQDWIKVRRETRPSPSGGPRE